MFIKTIYLGLGAGGLLLAQTVAQAQTPDADSLALQMANAVPASRFFVRAGAIGFKINTKSGNTYDVTGPVSTQAELQAVAANAGAIIEASIYARDPVGAASPTSSRDTTPNAKTIASLLTGGSSGTGPVNVKLAIDAMVSQGLTQIGTPQGVKALAEEKAITSGLSLGYYLSDDYTWLVEAYVLGKPLETEVKATGLSTWRENTTDGVYLQPFGLEGQTVVTTKMLPVNVMLGKYWGHKHARLRLYTGAIASYAIFYDTQATEALNSFNGGAAPGDTTVSFKNAFGIGPVLGAKLQLNKAWHLNLNVGFISLKTQGTLVTRNTTITKNTLSTQEYGSPSSGDPTKTEEHGLNLSDTLATVESLVDKETGTVGTTNNRALIDKLGGVTGVVLGAVAYNRGQTNSGTYVRKAESTLNTTLFMLNLGHSF